MGRRGGTALAAGGPARAVAFSTAEIVALVVASHMARDTPYSNAGRAAIDKLLDAMDDAERVGVEALRARFRLAPAESTVPRRVLSVVEDAVRDQTSVRLTYCDRNDHRTRRTVDPVGLYLDGSRWSLIGWCHLRQDGRICHLERISRADPTSRSCPSRDPDDVLGWVPRPGRRA